jgi:hypothetical protein
MVGVRGFVAGWVERSGFATLCVGALVVACSSSSASKSQGVSGTGSGGESGSNGGSAGSFVLGGSGGQINGGSSGQTNGGSSGQISGGAGGAAACPDLHTSPAGCPTKVLPVPAEGSPFLTLSQQAHIDALEGYTEIDSAITIASDSSGSITTLEPLHCLQSAPLGISVTSWQLTSLDGLRELTRSGGVKVTNNPLAVMGCGLRKLTTDTPVEISANPMMTRVDLPMLDASVVDIFIERNDALESIDLSHKIRCSLD